MVKNNKLFIIVILIIILSNIDYKSSSQTIVPQCFEKEDCKVSMPKGYCEITYNCVIGKCYHSFTKCAEICAQPGDEDLDGLSDCKDPDCYNSPYCPCDGASHDICLKWQCYCPEGMKPTWFSYEEEASRCGCD